MLSPDLQESVDFVVRHSSPAKAIEVIRGRLMQAANDPRCSESTKGFLAAYAEAEIKLIKEHAFNEIEARHFIATH